ncbi:SpoIVB peptidase [Lihuaxuella thermophila]|uniref:Stage IV sporulation protein B n=1 Tax=Lihuaxuella thermophila TaxID=1173111 RepID=A0A1H8ETZ2_9BACL|nr:SpoIVB peptidase [Lihuaxuella thermophila]SEN22218.1 stage IV sporulation protein B [Lihuaxuella thermophila]
MLQRNKNKKWMGFLLVLLLILGSTTTTFRQFTDFPAEIRLFQGQFQKLHLSMPVSATASISNPDVIQVNGSAQRHVPVDLHQPVSLFSHTSGKALLTLKLFGTLPIKKVNVSVYPEVKVIPGGQSIGVKLKSSGVLVVGHHLVDADRDSKSPAEQADIRAGDYLVRMNGKVIHEVVDVVKAVEEAGKNKKPLEIILIRDGKEKQVSVTPAYDKKERVYRLGIYIRDSAAGVGTLTFYDPKRHVYGALGHVISDIDTGQPILVGSGKIVQSNVTSIQKGESGEPGEKRAIFFQEEKVLGNITKNTPFGIFGKMKGDTAQKLQAEPIPVALAEQVKQGPAKILTVVEGQKVEAFDIQILHVLRQKFPATKGLIIKVTDPRLLDKTGGIVQGMSGSPIIQDGKLVGAVTHVSVNTLRQILRILVKSRIYCTTAHSNSQRLGPS